MAQMKLNNGKIKLNEKISNMKYICIYIYMSNLKR